MSEVKQNREVVRPPDLEAATGETIGTVQKFARLLSEYLSVRLWLDSAPSGNLWGRIDLPGDLPYLNIEIRVLGAVLVAGHIDLV